MNAAPLSLDQAIWLFQHGQLDAAAEYCLTVIRQQARNFDAVYLLGVIRGNQRKIEEAAEYFKKAAALKPKSFEAHYNLGSVLSEIKQHQAAIISLQKALRLKADSAEAHFSLGNALVQAGRHDEATKHFERVVAIRPDSAEAHHNLGIALAALERYESAAARFDRASSIKPDYVEAHYELGNALAMLKHYDGAIRSFEKTLALRPDYVEAHNNLGNVLAELDHHNAAIESFQRALAIEPDHADANNNLGNALTTLKLYDAAFPCYKKALASKPDLANAFSMHALTKRYLCDWQDIDKIEFGLIDNVRSGGMPIAPFPILAITDDPAVQLSCASQYWDSRKIANAPFAGMASVAKTKIRLGYVSSDFHEHATAYLMAALFERHDRARFEVSAFSYGPDDKSPMRQRLETAFDHFIDVGRENDVDAARRIAEREIDILIDLKGYTEDGRLEILAHRPAPVQVHYLGYPGTLGVDFIDYMIVDPFIVPPDQQEYFTEKLVYLPDCYQVNDPERRISGEVPTRLQCGLPEEGFVFCSFNNSYKITPAVFAVWMRLLAAVPGSVLWLLSDNPWAEENLRREATAQGIEPQRLVFAPRLPLPEHLARHRLADLFLDTLPYNAHTTASDALWAGLPVLSCAGRSFVARVAGSLLRAVGLPELITDTLAAYETLALTLARDPARLTAIRRKLGDARLTAPLFDADRTRRQIEAAYLAMWDIHQNGETPRSFAVPVS